jgi:hypothetical protein
LSNRARWARLTAAAAARQPDAFSARRHNIGTLLQFLSRDRLVSSHSERRQSGCLRGMHKLRHRCSRTDVTRIFMAAPWPGAKAFARPAAPWLVEAPLSQRGGPGFKAPGSACQIKPVVDRVATSYSSELLGPTPSAMADLTARTSTGGKPIANVPLPADEGTPAEVPPIPCECRSGR